jgi:hypothetical protein
MRQQLIDVRLRNAVHQLMVSLERDSILFYAVAFYHWSEMTKERCSLVMPPPSPPTLMGRRCTW